MQAVLVVLLALVGSWMQVFFFGSWRPLGVVPNLLAVLIILAGLKLRTSDTLWLAVLGGLFIDLSSGADFGLRMAFYSLLALLVAVLARLGLDFDNLGTLALMLLVATSIYNLAVVSNLVIAGASIEWSVVVVRTTCEFGLNCLLLFILRPVANRFSRESAVPQMSLGRRHG